MCTAAAVLQVDRALSELTQAMVSSVTVQQSKQGEQLQRRGLGNCVLDPKLCETYAGSITAAAAQ